MQSKLFRKLNDVKQIFAICLTLKAPISIKFHKFITKLFLSDFGIQKANLSHKK